MTDKDKLIPFLREADSYLSGALAKSHLHLELLIQALESTELSTLQKKILATARKELARSQNEFLARFGDMREPGIN
jgi:hypothetical protein